MFGVGWLAKKTVTGLCDLFDVDDDTAEVLGTGAKWVARLVTGTIIFEAPLESIFDIFTDTDVVDNFDNNFDSDNLACASLMEADEKHEPSFGNSESHEPSFGNTGSCDECGCTGYKPSDKINVCICGHEFDDHYYHNFN